MTTPTCVVPGEDSTTPGVHLYLVDSEDEPLEQGPGGPRRPSTASLSRFRSCPQLSSADGHTQESPGSEDHGLGIELSVGNVHFTQGSPRAAQRHQAEQDPSRAQSPCSSGSPRDRITSLEESIHRAQAEREADATAAATLPRVVRRAHLEHMGLGRTTSIDGPYNEAALRFFDDSHPRSEELGSERGSRHLSQFFEEPPELSVDGRLTMTEDGTSVLLAGGQHGYQPDQDSMDKCARWLQSLKMTSGDRIKSRSHVQLPPL